MGRFRSSFSSMATSFGAGLGLNENMFQEVDPTGAAAAALTIKITVESVDPETRATNSMSKQMKFENTMYVADACAKVAENFHMTHTRDKGLYFLSHINLNECYWLDPTKTLRYYDIHNLDEVVY